MFKFFNIQGKSKFNLYLVVLPALLAGSLIGNNEVKNIALAGCNSFTQSVVMKRVIKSLFFVNVANFRFKT